MDIRGWQEAEPSRGVFIASCVLIDEMNSGSRKLILAEADLPLFTFRSPQFPPLSVTSWFRSLVLYL